MSSGLERGQDWIPTRVHLMQVSEQLAELQLTLGEGPSLDAYASGGPVLASDLGASETAGRWPVFADTAALLLLDAAAQAAAGAEAGTGPAGLPQGLARHRAEIDQATGMLTEQLGVGITDAFARLRAYA
jgi:hypothetical protein